MLLRCNIGARGHCPARVTGSAAFDYGWVRDLGTFVGASPAAPGSACEGASRNEQLRKTSEEVRRARPAGGVLAGRVAALTIAGPDCRTLAGTPSTFASAQSLAEALATFYSTNPGLDANCRALLASDEEVAFACSGYRPSLFGGGMPAEAVLRHRVQQRQGHDSDDVFSNELALGVEQNLYRGGGTVAEVKSARSLVETQRATLDNARQNLFVDTITAYANVRRDETVLQSAEANVGRFEQQLDATDKRLRVGEATRTDRSQAEARIALARAQLSEAVANLETSRGNFLAVVGVPPATLETIGPPRRCRRRSRRP